MLDAKAMADWSQAIAGLTEMCPPMWWGLFKGCKEQGFTDEQAMRLVIAFIKSQENQKEN